MREHRYMAENLGRRTYLKGSFTGRFVGRLDPYRSDAQHERFFDMEVTEGEIVARQDQVTGWQDGAEDPEFATGSALHVKLPGQIAVALHYLDGSVKHFKVSLKEIKLLRCGLSDKVYQRDDVYGTIRGEVSGYVLHRDTVMNEIKENGMSQDSTISAPAGRGVLKETTGFSIVPPKAVNLRHLFFFSVLSLLLMALVVSDNWLPVVGCFVLGGLAVLWQHKKGFFHARRPWLVTILLYCVLFAAGLGWVLSHAIGTGQKTREEMAVLKQKGLALLNGKNYQEALNVFDALVSESGSKSDLRISRALCYAGLGELQKAVADLKPIVSEGDTTAIQLYNRINPLKKRQTGTQIRCRDGTVSHSKHRQGTCSHHGGVENWEEPVYEEYREYN